MILANRVGPWCPKIIIDSTWLYSLYFHLIQSNKPSFIWKWHKWDNFRDIFLIKQCWTEASSVTYVTWCPTKLIPTTFAIFIKRGIIVLAITSNQCILFNVKQNSQFFLLFSIRNWIWKVWHRNKRYATNSHISLIKFVKRLGEWLYII